MQFWKHIPQPPSLTCGSHCKVALNICDTPISKIVQNNGERSRFKDISWATICIEYLLKALCARAENTENMKTYQSDTLSLSSEFKILRIQYRSSMYGHRLEYCKFLFYLNIFIIFKLPSKHLEIFFKKKKHNTVFLASGRRAKAFLPIKTFSNTDSIFSKIS